MELDQLSLDSMSEDGRSSVMDTLDVNLRQDLASLVEHNTSLSHNMESLSDKNSHLEVSVDQLKRDNLALRNTLLECEAQISKLVHHNQVLQDQVDTLTPLNDELTCQVELFTKERAEKEVRIQQLSDENRLLSAQLDDTNESQTGLEATEMLQELLNRISSLKARCSGLSQAH
ncbi:hypothetical protein P9112_003256 [Eukaryota sp. TZLM1-RC]